MRRVFLLLAALALCPSLAYAQNCTKHGTVGISSTQIVPARDVSPRSFMLVENSGNANGMWVAIDTHNSATTMDVFLKPGASLQLSRFDQAVVPAGDVAAISTGTGTTYAFCDY